MSLGSDGSTSAPAPASSRVTRTTARPWRSAKRGDVQGAGSGLPAPPLVASTVAPSGSAVWPRTTTGSPAATPERISALPPGRRRRPGPRRRWAFFWRVDREHVARRPLLAPGRRRARGRRRGAPRRRSRPPPPGPPAGGWACRRPAAPGRSGGGIDRRRPGDDAGRLVGEAGAAHPRRAARRDLPQVARAAPRPRPAAGRDRSRAGSAPGRPAMTRSPGLVRAADDDAVEGRPHHRAPGELAGGRRRALRPRRRSPRPARGRAGRPPPPCGRRCRAGTGRRGGSRFSRAVTSCAWARARSERLAAASASRLGISKRTSSSPRRTRSPTPFGISAMRASCGGTTSSSAPAAGFTWPVAATTARIGPACAVATVTGTASTVSTASGEALWQAARARRAGGRREDATCLLRAASRSGMRLTPWPHLRQRGEGRSEIGADPAFRCRPPGSPTQWRGGPGVRLRSAGRVAGKRV